MGSPPSVPTGVGAPPPGLLRVLVLFHEAEQLGAGNSVLGCVDRLERYGWALSGWLPDRGPLSAVAEERLRASAWAPRPFAFSVRGWGASPGVGARLRRSPAYLQEVRRALLRFRPHIVHANTLLTLPEATVARSLGLPLVIQVHEHPPAGRKRSVAVRAAARLADVLVGVSDATSAALRASAGRVPVRTVHNGVATNGSGRVEPRSTGCTIGTVATVSRTKGTDVFCRAAQLAAARRPGLRFEHVGAGDLHRDVGLDEELHAIGGSPELVTALVRRGRLPAQEALSGMDVFVLASRSEAFPLATLEAMAAGLPIIATAVGGVPEQLVHLESGILVPPEDPAAIADWIIRLADDAALRQRLGAAAADRARNLFTLDRQAAGLHGAYLTALVRRYGPPAARRAL